MDEVDTIRSQFQQLLYKLAIMSQELSLTQMRAIGGALQDGLACEQGSV